ncbi:uncharacterized protein MYCFIDRAFT_194756 [Pseudocercospora fijiensis CIRAD86]|uniref:PHD-type domain-containing protein n=1 Tax=Pseudocercospora fijiensis (strain CIRAD86) TaxID=383855 RepID=M3AQC6_PSEFD|nr:uncharacterized protein MYCFIDRAFT_194756 [Pseudocercospora fijiensis CIRAD86]EME86801.1 hypothetical protein MYCFIDRAFT_194756 [Pseudocercospora fijiensis CIRAD86]
MDTAPRLDTPGFGQSFATAIRRNGQFADSQDPNAYAVPKRRLRSTSRQAKQHQLLAELAKKSANTSPHALPRLRRVRAFSPSEDHVSSSSPTVSIEVSKEDWLENAITKTKAIMLDMENVDRITRRLSLSSVSSFDTCSSCGTLSSIGSNGPASPSSLHRKDALEDLRSHYTASESHHTSINRLSASTSSGASAATSLWSSMTDDGSATSNDTVVWRDAYCLCGRSHHPAHGPMITCDVCDGSYHVRCVGMEHLEATNYDEASFTCPCCEEVAFREIIEEEE